MQPGGRLIALDVDPIEVPKAEARLRALGFPEGSLAVRRGNFAGLAALLAAEAPAGADVILADLGLSSMQIDDPARGFTFKADGPLDMRMDPARGRPASALLAGVDEAALARLLAENADEPRAAAVAAAIVRRGRGSRWRRPGPSRPSSAPPTPAAPRRRPTTRSAASSRRSGSRSTTSSPRSTPCSAPCPRA